MIIDGVGGIRGACKPTCDYNVAILNHARWPDGVADGGTDWEDNMLDFLRVNPL